MEVQEAGYVGIPLAPQNASSTDNGCERSIGEEVCPQIGEQAEVLPGRAEFQTADCEDDSTCVEGSSNTGNSDTVISVTSGGPSTTDVTVTEEHSVSGRSRETMLAYMLHYLDMVLCDDLFMALCMVVDERLKSMFHIIVGAFRQKCSRWQPKAPYLVRFLLDCSHDKAFGVKDRKKHEEREECLRSAKDNFALVQSLYCLK